MSCAENDREGETGKALSEVNYRQKSSDLVFSASEDTFYASRRVLGFTLVLVRGYRLPCLTLLESGKTK